MNMQTGGLRGEYFVGRRDAFRAFDQFLENGDKRIFLITGDGGIGKTWLLGELKKYALKSSKHGSFVVTTEVTDLISTKYHRISNLWSCIIELSGKPEPFERHSEEYRALQVLREDNREYPRAERALQDKSFYVHQLFYEGCKGLPGTVVYWFDTFEAVRDDPVGRWLLEELPRNAGNLRLVIAGRPLENEHEVEINDEFIQSYKLSGLDPSEAKEFYLNRFGHQPSRLAPSNAVPDAQVWERLCEKLDYHPLYIDLAGLWVKSQVTDYEELSEIPKGEIIETLFRHLQSVMRIPGFISEEESQNFSSEKLDNIERAAYEVILYMALLDRRFDEHFLEVIYPDPGEPSLEFAQLALRRMGEVPAIFFVKEREGGLAEGGYLQLHDEVRDQVREILWAWRDPLGEERQELAQKVIGVYDQLIDRTADDRLREELKVERLNYLLRIDLQQGYQQFEEDFKRNLENQNWGICQLLLNELSPYEEVNDLGLPRVQKMKDYKFRLALEQGYFKTAETLAETKAQKADYWLELQRHYLNIDLDQAKQCARKALALAQAHGLTETQARAERALGYVHKALGALNEAIRWYQESQESARKLGKEGAWLYADALNNEGYIWSLYGDYARAQELVETAMRLRKDHDWRYEMALSLSTLGEIARFAGSFHVASKRYQKATEVFQELHAYDWEAIVWQQRAENARSIAEQERNDEFTDKEREQKYIEYAVQDINNSLALYHLYRLRRERPRVWRILGAIVRDRGDLKAARAHFVKAFKLAKDNKDYQESLQAIINIAKLEISQGEYQRAEQTLAQVDYFAQASHFLIFSALRDTLQAKTLVAREDYDEARRYFIRGVVRLAQEPGYGHARLSSIIEQLDTWLSTLPAYQQREWCKALLEAWKKNGLTEDVPRLPPIVSGYLAALDFS
jgi:tetratricopeptide (TPR) repeat protein